MPSLDQADTVTQLLSEGWATIPNPDKLTYGGHVLMERTRNGVIDKIAVLPDGKAVPQDAQP